MLGVTGEVVARAQESGELREDLVAEDVPALICGLGRAVRVRGRAPDDELGALPRDHPRRPARLAQPTTGTTLSRASPAAIGLAAVSAMAAETLSAAEAAARLEPTDTLGIPLGTGQPPAFLAGARASATTGRTCASTAPCCSSGTELFNHPNVHYLSGFFGPIERALRDAGREHQLRPRRLPPLRAAARAAARRG